MPWRRGQSPGSVVGQLITWQAVEWGGRTVSGVEASNDTTPRVWPADGADGWRVAAARHQERVEVWTAGWRHRRARGQRHPVDDFLFTYYPVRPARLARWHPGPGVLLQSDDTSRRRWRFYRSVAGGTTLDLDAFLAARGSAVAGAVDILRATAGRRPHFGCFGLHEWAMVYRQAPDQVRHAAWPLRLGLGGTDAVVEAHELRCSHFDAYRFFTPQARPRNAVPLTRATQVDHEQPACLHAAMDLYRWSATLAPGVPSDLTADCFELARAARELDMRASPYDLSDLGYVPIRIETLEGKAEYVAGQRAIAATAAPLRERLLAALCALTAHRSASV